MSGLESEAVKVGQFFMSAIIYKIKTYVNYINKCEENLGKLLDELEKLRANKDTIDDKVLSGKESSKILTPKAELWFECVRKLVSDESMKRLMNTDMRVAKVMLRLMKTDLKKLVEDDGEIRELVVKVMKDITKTKRKDGNREVPHVDENDKKVSQVLEKLMEETIDEFKKLMQNDEKMAIAAMHLLENHKEKLEELTEKDPEVAHIIAKARKMSHEEEFPSDNHDAENGTKDNVVANVNTLRNKVTNLLKPVGNLILNEEVLKTLPENVRLGVEAMGVVIGNRRGLKAELMDYDDIHSHRNGCCGVISYNYFSDRYDMSVAAEAMLFTIKEIIGSEPGSQDVTRSKRRGEMEAIPTNCVEVKSRKELFGKIIKALASNDINAVGVFGMGGSGKTTLATEVANSKANGIFGTTVMVEISESPNIESIQNQIGDGLGLKLHDVHGIREKAILLYNRLKPEEKSEGRKDDNKAEKVLIVLDNIWNKIDLVQIGIPRDYCKLLLTSRLMEVCISMDIREPNIFEVGLLNDNEAKDLFEFEVQKKVNIGEYKSVADRLLKKCGGLPLSIVATANSLKGHELQLWRQFADELEKPISCQISGARHETFSILRTSYEIMASEEKRKFFLLACLSSAGSTISIDDMMRYGIGLGLFQHVNKLSEAVEQAHTWAEELVSSSMLLKGDSEDRVKVHDVVRESTLSFASKSDLNKDRQMIMVDAIPRWIFEETFNQYTCISLWSQANYARLNGVKADLLQMLLLEGSGSSRSFLESNVFQGMKNLKVLKVSSMNFEKGLPESMGKLKHLKTLYLVTCKLGDIKLIGELESLLVLSLRDSYLERLPDEIGKLYNLQLLDMSKCWCEQPVISDNVIARLTNLEGLYMLNNNFTGWGATLSRFNDTEVINGAIMDELSNLKFLNVLEIGIEWEISLPISAQFVKNLDKFQIHVGRNYFIEPQPFHRVLTLVKVDVNQELKKYTCLKALLKKADFLSLEGITVKNIVPQLDEEGFKDLCSLRVGYLDDISILCEGKAPTELFLNLCHLQVSGLAKLEELLPSNPLPSNLTTLKIYYCRSLTYIFSENRGSPPSIKDDGVVKESDIIDIELPCLKILKLEDVYSLISVVKGSNIDDSRRQGFFNNKVKLPSLEEFALSDNESILKLWGTETNMHSFQKLKVLKISNCKEMETIGPPSMFLSLEQLETLTVNDCNKMQQVISKESEGQEIPDETIIFPKLKFLSIESSKNIECFYDGDYTIKFPCLEELRLINLKCMAKFAGYGDTATFFHEKIEFSSLEEVKLMELKDEVVVLWDLHELMAKGNHIPMLKKLGVGKIKLPSIVLHSLSCLQVEPTADAKFVLSSSENEGCLWTYSQLPKLEELIVQDCPNSMEQLVEDDGSTAMLKFCDQLRRLTLKSASYMEVICLHLFKSLLFLSISKTRSEYLFSANGGLKHLQSLEELYINYCPSLRLMFQGGDKYNVVLFPRLKKLRLDSLKSMSNFSSIPDTPLHFPSLEILDVSWCEELETIYMGPFVAPRLRELMVSQCGKLQWLFSGEPNLVELPCLDKLIIDNCATVKCLSTRPLKAAKLRELELSDCAKMEWLLLGNTNCGEDLELPYLERVTIENCANLKSFSQAVLRAPKLQLLKVDNDPYSFFKTEDLNQLLQSIAEMTVDFRVNSVPDIQIESELNPELEPISDTKLNPEPDSESDLGVETIANP